MLLDEPVPSELLLFQRFAEKRIGLIFEINGLRVVQSIGQDMGCDFLVNLDDREPIRVAVKWYENRDLAREYLRDARQTTDTSTPHAIELAIVVNRGDEVLVDSTLADLLTIIPEEITVTSIDKILRNRYMPG